MNKELKIIEVTDELLGKTIWGLVCGNCYGGGTDDVSKTCGSCNGTGIVGWNIKSFQDLLHQQAQLSFEAGMKYAIEYIAKENAWEESEVYFKEQLLSPKEFKKSLTEKQND